MITATRKQPNEVAFVAMLGPGEQMQHIKRLHMYVYVHVYCICAVIQKVTQQRETRDLFRKSPNFQGAKLLPLLRLVQNTRRHLHHWQSSMLVRT